MGRKKDRWFEWEEKYKPVKNHIDKNSSMSGFMFETFEEEIKHVFDLSNTNVKKVWTIIEAEGKWYISAGFHVVNRIGFLITEKEWEKETEEYYID